MFKMKYSQKFGLTISVVVSLLVIISFLIYGVLFSTITRKELRTSMISEINEVISSFILYDANGKKLQFSKPISEIDNDVVRDRLSLAVYDINLQRVGEFGIFAEISDTNFVNDTAKYADRVQLSIDTGSSTFYTLTDKETKKGYEMVVSPIKNDNKSVGAIVLLSPVDQINKILSLSGTLILFITPLAFLLSYLLGTKFSGKAYEPIRDLIEQVKKVSSDNLDLKIREDGHPEDESRILSKEYNEMLSRLSEGIEKQKNFISNASHELRTPLSRIQTSLDLIESESKFKKEASDEIVNMGKLIDTLSVLAKIRKYKPGIEAHNLKKIVAEVIEENKYPVNRLNIEISEDVVISLTVTEIKLILVNLISNALKYSNSEHKVDVSFLKNDLVIKDDGIGIPKKDLDIIPQPFYRANNAKQNGNGTGLGLSIVKEIADKYNFSFNINSEEGKGTEVRVQIRN